MILDSYLPTLFQLKVKSGKVIHFLVVYRILIKEKVFSVLQ